MTERRSFAAIGTICHVLVTDERTAERAAAITKAQLGELSLACSRFRADSELSSLPRGRTVGISPLLTELLAAGIRTARRTDGLVDPTVGLAMRRLGYDEDFATVVSRPVSVELINYQPAPGFWRNRPGSGGAPSADPVRGRGRPGGQRQGLGG